MNNVKTQNIEIPVIDAEYFFEIGDRCFNHEGFNSTMEKPLIYFDNGIKEWVFMHGNNKIKNEKAKEFCRKLNRKTFH